MNGETGFCHFAFVLTIFKVGELQLSVARVDMIIQFMEKLE